MKPYIYALIDPTTKECRYVGKADNPVKRYRDHMSTSARTKKGNWLKKLKALGIKPHIVVLERCADANWQEKEIFWIAYMKWCGANLVNGTIGGDGRVGFKHSEETKKKMSAAHKGKSYYVATPETRKKISVGNTGKVRSDEFKAKISQYRTGKTLSAEAKAKVSAAMKTRVVSEETKKKISAGKMGSVPWNKGTAKPKPPKQPRVSPMKGRSGLLSPLYQRPRSEDTKRKISETWKLREKKKFLDTVLDIIREEK